MSIAVVAHLTSTARAALLFTDGDSMLPILVMRSLDVSQPLDWAMSSVLFLPELLVFGIFWLLAGGENAAVLLNAVFNFVCLYVALRIAAGSRARARAPVAAAIAGFAVFLLIAALDSSGNRNALELASLMVTATYYSATVVAVIVSVALVRRTIEAPLRRWLTPTTLGIVATISVLSNPLYLLWAAAPIGILLGVNVLRARSRPHLWSLGALVAGSAAGWAGRVPFAHYITNDGLGYVNITHAALSLKYYLALVGARWQSAGGIASVLLTVAVFVLAVTLSVRLRTSTSEGARFVATAAWVIPVAVTVGAVILGTHAARYLQPVVFAPILAITVLPEASRIPPVSITNRRVLIGIGSVAALTAVVLGVPTIVAAANRQDSDLACVTTWVNKSGQTGAGQFWTVRLPKAHLMDPHHLVQVTATMHPYNWLINRADNTVPAVSFLLLDDQSTPFKLPDGKTLNDATIITCGRYTIADFNDHPLQLGTPRS